MQINITNIKVNSISEIGSLNIGKTILSRNRVIRLPNDESSGLSNQSPKPLAHIDPKT